MSEALPSVSLIIAARPGQPDIQALAAGRALDYPREKLEILIARGNQPAVQRNVALRQAKGDVVYFLDDDSRPSTQNLRRGVSYFARAEVQMVGGPNLCPPAAPPREQAFAAAMGCWLAFGPSRARYRPVGPLRESSEKELILCNLMARRSALVELGGFDESLYPNEENALMDDLQARGGKLLYDPEFLVYRRPRRTWRAFARMLRTYGRGRAEQFRLHPTLGSALNFVPPLFCVYLVAALILRGWWLAPLLLYALALGVQAGWLRGAGAGLRLRVLLLVALTHLFYGLGFWHGLFTPLKRSAGARAVSVALEHLPV